MAFLFFVIVTLILLRKGEKSMCKGPGAGTNQSPISCSSLTPTLALMHLSGFCSLGLF